MTEALSCRLDRRAFLMLSGAGLALGAVASRPGAALAQAAGKMKIATIGAGHEGGALGTLFAKQGHQVMFSSRNPDQLKTLVANAGPNASAGTVAEAVAFGEVVFIAVPYTAIEKIGHEFGPQLAAKPLVFDASNPIVRRDGDAFVKQIADEGGPGIATAKLIPGAHVVRGFNAIGGVTLGANAHRAGDPVGVPIAGDDQNAIKIAESLIREIGFAPVLIGGLAMGKYLVPGTPLGGVHTPTEIHQIVAKLT